MKRLLLLSIVVLFCILSLESNDMMKKVLEIGNDSKENYTFFSISSVCSDDEENIYVFDGKGYYLRKYDKKGRFIRQVGKKGQGPGDFSFSSSVSYMNEIVYLYDSLNRRIAMYTKNLELKGYIKLERDFPMFAGGFQGFDNKFYFSVGIGNRGDKIIITDKNAKVLKKFFKNIPEYLKKYSNLKDRKRKVLRDFYSKIIYDINKNQKNMFITFVYPEKVELFRFSLYGEILNKIKLDIIKDYEIPKSMNNLSLKYTNERSFGIDSLLSVKKYVFIIFYESEKNKIVYRLLIYDFENQKIINNKEVNYIRLVHSSEDKLYVVSEDEDGCIKLEVYKIGEK